jgi:hypothetical protein
VSEVSHSIQNFLICMETAGFAITHHIYFNYRDFDGEYSAVDALRYGLSRAVLDMVPADFVVDVGELLQGWVGYGVESAPKAALAAAKRRATLGGEHRGSSFPDDSLVGMSGSVLPDEGGRAVIDTETLLRAVQAVRGARMGNWDPAAAGVAPPRSRSRGVSSATLARARRETSTASSQFLSRTPSKRRMSSRVEGDDAAAAPDGGATGAAQQPLLGSNVGLTENSRETTPGTSPAP